MLNSARRGQASANKVLHVIPSLQLSQGGTVECVSQISRGLSKAGYSVSIVSLEDLPGSRAHYAVEVIDVGKRWFKYAFSLRLLVWLLKNVRNYDIVVINGIWQFHGVATWIAASICRVPYTVYPHGMMTKVAINSDATKRLKKVIYWSLVERWILSGAARVFCTSMAEMQGSVGYLPGTPKLKFELVGNGVETPDPMAVERDLHVSLARYQLVREKYLLYLGRIHSIKGLEILLAAYASVYANQHDHRLVIAGPVDSEYSEGLKATSHELGLGARICWTGLVKGESKWCLLAGASALVLPSHHENFAIVVAEALSMGTPVLTTHEVGTSKEVMEYSAGLVSEDTQKGFGEIILEWSGMEEGEKQAMRVNAKRCFQENFVLDLPVKRLAGAFDGILGAGPNTSLQDEGVL